jgi:hypothetical protein
MLKRVRVNVTRDILYKFINPALFLLFLNSKKVLHLYCSQQKEKKIIFSDAFCCNPVGAAYYLQLLSHDRKKTFYFRIRVRAETMSYRETLDIMLPR